jgi:hypothetical protein
VISNPKLTRKVVYGVGSRGVPALGLCGILDEIHDLISVNRLVANLLEKGREKMLLYSLNLCYNTKISLCVLR